MNGVRSQADDITRVRATSPAAGPESRIWAQTSAFARAMFSRLPRMPMWEVPMVVTQASEGEHAPARREISPGWFMPSSQTTTSESSGAASSVSGMPMRLLRLPAVAWVRRQAPKPARSMSFVVVLPTEPVTPTTSHSGWRRRCSAASASRNASQSSSLARRTEAPSAAQAASTSGDTSAEATTAAAPVFAAAAR